ncbi:hypothetical protein MchiMG62_07960 [Methanoculleus chikugoensis]|uniref:Uncharacterized protein n=1 Tax=Methanoculleus chikugoensis TaxID=118126 RepID=A0ABN5XFR8_9EURY|nr:hypothetical protein MchiMG62_07960 [Methanoculleus chikugoensis]
MRIRCSAAVARRHNDRRRGRGGNTLDEQKPDNYADQENDRQVRGGWAWPGWI